MYRFINLSNLIKKQYKIVFRKKLKKMVLKIFFIHLFCYIYLNSNFNINLSLFSLNDFLYCSLVKQRQSVKLFLLKYIELKLIHIYVSHTVLSNIIVK